MRWKRKPRWPLAGWGRSHHPRSFPLRLEPLEQRLVLDYAPLVISELMAINDRTYLDDRGEYSDWIEIHNPTAAVVNLEGWHLTDNDGNLTKWQFPAASIQPRGYLVVFATDDEEPDPAHPLHTNFKLSGDGEYLALVGPDGVTVVSEYDPEYPQQLAEVSYGLEMRPFTVLSQGSAAKVLVPADGSLGTTWTSVDFVDAAWSEGFVGVGYEVPNRGLSQESEPNDTRAAANNAAYSFTEYSGNLYHLGIKGSLGSSLDYFKIGSLDVGDVLTVTLSGSASSRGSVSNPLVRLYRGNASSPVLVLEDDDSGPGLDALIARYPITTADTYYVCAAKSGSISDGSYDLGLWLENSGPPPATGGTWKAEAESNNTAAQANNISTSWRPVLYRSQITGAVGAAGDVDYYQCPFTAGDLLSVYVDSTSTLDAKVTLLNPLGATIASEDGTSGFSSPYDLDSPLYAFIIPNTGTYYLKVEALGGTGTYTLDCRLSSATTAPMSFTRLINTDLAVQMRSVNPSVYLRIPFSLDDPTAVNSLSLRMKYDDGFVAYLNGQWVASRNAPGMPAYNSIATATRADNQATVFEEISLNDYVGLLGTDNVLAIQGLNISRNDNDFLIVPELVGTMVVRDSQQYFTTPTPGARNISGALGQVDDVKYSVDRGFYDAPFDVVLSTATPGAEIRYTTDGRTPTATGATLYTGPIHIGTTTTLRAAAFEVGYLTSPVDTHTYLFLSDVIRQPANPAGFPSQWVDQNTNIAPGNPSADYAMDPEVVDNPLYRDTIIDDLKSIPTLSLVMNVDDWFGNGSTGTNGIKGIYSNPMAEDSAGAVVKLWERAVSLELIYPDGNGPEGDADFQIDAGVQIHGGASREPAKNVKHSFTVSFKSCYGGALEYPLFGDDAAERFESLVLRAGFNNTWTHWDTTQRNHAQYVHDTWSDLVQAAMGQPYRRDEFVHLYINGLYWGLYNLTEFPDDAYAATYLGGEEADYDVIKGVVIGTVEAAEGNLSAWNAMMLIADRPTTDPRNLSTAEGYADIQKYLDIQNFVDYMIVKFFGGDMDWDHHNWIAVRRSRENGVARDGLGGFMFFNWDGERVLEGTGDNRTSLNNANDPSHLFQQLRQNAEFRLFWADRVHEHLFNDGPLTPTNAAALYATAAAMVDQAVVAESARWGDWRRDVLPSGTAYLYTRDGFWVVERDRILNQYFPVRTNNVLTQFRNIGLYPSTAAPEFGRHGGDVLQNYSLAMVNPNGVGTVWYTLDGSDPRLPGGAVSGTAVAYSGPVTLTNTLRAKARVLNGATWSALTEAQFYVGPQAAAESLAITEINYHPYGPTADDFEFIELRNVGNQRIGLTDVRFTEGIDFSFSGGSVTALDPGQFVVLVRNPAAFAVRYGTGILVAGQYGGALENAGERLTLLDHHGLAIRDFTYGDSGPWPGRADGKGSSLELVAAGSGAAAADWRSSSEYGGSPGAAGVGPRYDVVITEVLTHTDLPLVDAVELHNTTAGLIDIGGWYLSDSSDDYRKFCIPDGTEIPAGEYLVFDEEDFGQYFAFDGAHGDDAWLLAAETNGKLTYFVDHVEFGAAVNGESFGRWPTWQDGMYPLLQRTLGAANDTNGNGPRVGPVVISEVMYNPPDPGNGTDPDDLEYVEIYNPTGEAIALSHWRLRGGIDFDFPDGAALPAYSALLVISFDPADPLNSTRLAAFQTAYPLGAGVQIVGGYQGKLANDGERVELQRPDWPPPDEPTFYPGLLEDEVAYSDLAPWPTGADGGGSSLQRLGADRWGDAAESWAAAAPTPGTPHMIAGRHIFYNGSAFDGRSGAANTQDFAAIAADKRALRSGETAGFDNYTGYSRGINGIMVDVVGLPQPAAVTADDFRFRVGNDSYPLDEPGTWIKAPDPSSVTVFAGAGVSGSGRVTIIWDDGAIQNQWLEVTVLVTPNSGLPAAGVFYFGNAVGESGDHRSGPSPDAVVDSADEEAARSNKTASQPAAITSLYDFNRDRRVNAADELIARNNYSNGSPLELIDLSGGGRHAGLALSGTALALGPGTVPLFAAERPSLPSGAAGEKGDCPPWLAAAHDAVFTAAAHQRGDWSPQWLWLVEAEPIGINRPAAKKTTLGAAAVDELLSAYWP